MSKLPTMKVAFDTEFLEWTDGDGTHIDLCSIGLVTDYGLEYYAECIEFDWRRAERKNPWLLENVKPHLSGGHVRKTRSTIKAELLRLLTDERPEFWAYYADYDWVAFCGLFGAMIDLPKHFPKFCMDLKQHMEMFNVDKSALPKQAGAEHNALDDARHNMEVMRFLGIAR